MKKESELDPSLEHEFELHNLKEDYEQTSNPLFIWEALKYCIDNEWPAPNWVLSYFKEVAEKLLQLPDRTEKFGQREGLVVLQILGMKKLYSNNFFDRYKIYKRNKLIVRRVCELVCEPLEKGGHKTLSIFNACEKISKEVNLGPETVSKIYTDLASKLGLTLTTRGPKKQKKTQ